jgi:hypothetical protein
VLLLPPEAADVHKIPAFVNLWYNPPRGSGRQANCAAPDK